MIVLYLHLFVLIIISFVINIIKNISFKKKTYFEKKKKQWYMILNQNYSYL